MKSWHSSTSPALNACAARVGPPTVKSLAADVLISRTTSGSKRRSSRVLRVETAPSGISVGYMSGIVLAAVPRLARSRFLPTPEKSFFKLLNSPTAIPHIGTVPGSKFQVKDIGLFNLEPGTIPRSSPTIIDQLCHFRP